MDLVSAISNMKAAQLNSAVQVSVARKVLDAQELQGGAALKLLNAASNGVTQAGDQLTARAIGLGGMLDTYA